MFMDKYLQIFCRYPEEGLPTASSILSMTKGKSPNFTILYNTKDQHSSVFEILKLFRFSVTISDSFFLPYLKKLT